MTYLIFYLFGIGEARAKAGPCEVRGMLLRVWPGGAAGREGHAEWVLSEISTVKEDNMLCLILIAVFGMIAWCCIRTCKGPGSPTDELYEEGS